MSSLLKKVLNNLASLYMLRCDTQKFKPILQCNVIINIQDSNLSDDLSSSSFQVSVVCTLRQECHVE